jgi:hypothetical protein
MWRVQRLDQINAFKPANLFDFKSLALKIRKKQIGRFKTVIRTAVVVPRFQHVAIAPRHYGLFWK